ncbi:MAG: 5-(carboxyamino)imidazole ribonucleotide synthase [Lentisphaeria bacterium]|nr:5-(carboxyamino)imidazole ribonucleotide synthase [Lentisphaeria bacterium]
MLVGILGAGQLAQMLAMSAQHLGVICRFYDPTPNSCAAIAGEQFVGAYDDYEKLDAFLDGVDVVTYEFENVPLACAEYVQKTTPVYPKPAALQATQDRLNEKNLFRKLGIETPGFLAVSSHEDLKTAANELGLPLVLKTRSGGYDGKGQYVVRSEDQFEEVVSEIAGIPMIAEAFINFSREVSIIAVRRPSGDMAFYDLAENIHKDGILHISENRPADPMFNQAVDMIGRLLKELDYFGVLALELFQVGDQLMANEYAPRVHNTGHWTMDGAATSQFENHMRAVLDWPLGATNAYGFSAMLNYIGKIPAAKETIEIEDSHYHNYGKKPKTGRKVGHINLRADHRQTLNERLQEALNIYEA